MKLIFLDIDGVLNYTHYWKHDVKERKRKLYAQRVIGENIDRATRLLSAQEDICPKAVQILNTIVEQTGAHVVISSSWRRMYKLQELQTILKACGFNGEVVGVTPYLRFEELENYKGYSVPRGCEIKAWIEINKRWIGEKVSKVKYVILDDDSDMLFWQRNNYLRTTQEHGLTEEIAQKAIAILNTQECQQ